MAEVSKKKEVKLPSGAMLKIGVAKFEESKALYQAFLEEAKTTEIKSRTEMANVYKDLICIGFGSKKIEACVWECMKYCTYSGTGADLKIDKDTFEPVAAREDYLTVLMEVAKENISPFGKSLYAEYGHVIKMILSDQT